MTEVKKVQENEVKPKTEKVEPKVDYMFQFKDRPMIHIKGNFMRGGFALSQTKVEAILKNIEVIKEFANGDFDEQIFALKDKEVLKVE
jgi:Holliday junction resolvase